MDHGTRHLRMARVEASGSLDCIVLGLPLASHQRVKQSITTTTTWPVGRVPDIQLDGHGPCRRYTRQVRWQNAYH